MSVRDAMRHAIQDNPSELKNSIYSALDTKVADALELKKISTASEYFNEPEEDYEEAEVEESLQGDPRHNPSASADRAAYDAPTDKEIAAAKRRKEALKLGRDRRETAIDKRKRVV